MKLSLFLLKFLVSLDYWKCKNMLHKMKKNPRLSRDFLLTLPAFEYFSLLSQARLTDGF